jgi:hypothetical protein
MLLSAMQLVTDQPMEQVFDSLELSMVTGPNEGYLMQIRKPTAYEAAPSQERQ